MTDQNFNFPFSKHNEWNERFTRMRTYPLNRAAVRCLAIGVISAAMAAAVPAQYFPNMAYGPKQPIAPGVTWQEAANPSPAQRVIIIEVDMTNKNVELMPVFKAGGNRQGSSTLERPSQMAARTNAVAAINAGYYDASGGTYLTNSYTEIDGVFIGGSNTNMRPEGNRSVLGFSGDHQTIAKTTKLSTTFVPSDPTDWDKIVDGIAGRGYFTWDGTNYTVDNESTSSSHNASRHPRTVIGYKSSPYTVYLVAVDGRVPGTYTGMTYTELAQLMADIGAEESISLDGGGSTLAWVKDEGIVNHPSDGSERSVANSWVVVQANTMDNTVSEATVSGTWTTDTMNGQLYYLDQLVTDDTAGAASVTWTPDLGEDGLYRVLAWYTEDAGRTAAAPYEIVHADGTDIVEVDQRDGGGQWRVLGIYPFEAGTGGSVTLSNSAPGSVSADAVRFVRIGEIPAAIEDGYDVTAVLYETDFENDVSGDFTISQKAVGDNDYDFQYDYATFAQTGGGFPQSIPPAPNSTGAGMHGLRLATNLSAGVTNAITATYNGAGADNVRITFDLWHNYNGGNRGGSGSTEFASFGASADPALYQMGVSSYASAGSPYSGLFFTTTSDGDSPDDYRYYDGNGTGGSNGNNSALVNYLGENISNHNAYAFLSTFAPEELYETPGNPSKTWNQWEIVVLEGKVRLLVTKPDGQKIVMCDWFTPNTNATLTNLRPALGIFDVYTSVAADTPDNFVLFDNLKLEAIEPPASVNNWELY